MKSFIDIFLDHTKEMESPETFFRWAAYAGVAAVLRDRVMIDLGNVIVWPNIYVILMARSAAMRKSVPLKQIGRLLREVPTHGDKLRVISGRISIQQVINELGEMSTDSKTGKMHASATGILMSEELAAFAPEDPATIPILTDLYDNHAEWTSSLVTRGKVVLKNTCVNLLAASNEPLFKTVYSNMAIRGGLLGRTFIVRESQKRTVNSLMSLEYENDDDWMLAMEKKHENKAPIEALARIAGLKGRAILEFAARVEHDRWYKEIDKQAQQYTSDTGVIERIHTGALKIALCIAVANSYELRIKKEHVEEAIDRCTTLLKNYEVITMGQGKSQSADAMAILLAFLWEQPNKRASFKHILRSNWQHFDKPTLDETLVPTLEGAGYLKEVIVENEPGLELTEKGKEKFESKL